MKHFLLALLAAATAAHARDYAFKDRPFEEGDFSTDGKAFIIHTISSGGNFCDLGGFIKHNVYRDGKGCEVRFAFARNKVSVTVPESAREACAEYCGHNAHFADQYHRLPAACTDAFHAKSIEAMSDADPHPDHNSRLSRDIQASSTQDPG